MPRKKQPEAAKCGRPREFGERLPLGLRVTKELKRKLRDISHESGRSLSQEAEFRLEQTFKSSSTLFEALDLAYGRHTTGLLLALGLAIQTTGTRCLMLSKWKFDGCEDWLADPYAFDQAVRAVNTILERFRPPGGMKISGPADLRQSLPPGSFEVVGKSFAELLLETLRNPANYQRADAETVRLISERLSDLLPK
jgi:hypothetical protein